MTATTDVAARYARLSEGFAEVVGAVPPDRWEAPSPCEGWTARDVVGHVVDAHAMFLRMVGRELGTVPEVAADPAGAFAGAQAVIARDLADPARATEEADGAFGRMRWCDAVDTFLCFDLAIHRWDLARAAGLDERLPDDDVRWVWERAEQFGDDIRREGVCGPALTPPEGADAQTRLLAHLGRRAW